MSSNKFGSSATKVSSASFENLSFIEWNDDSKLGQFVIAGIGLMQETHAAEIAQLCESFESKLRAERAEKERLIAEETRATQLAIEAMQRQHRSHIEELKSNFKSPQSAPTEPTAETNASRTIEPTQTHRLPAANEKVLNEIREDIVNLSEKFSKKCVEAAAVQERLYATQKQLQKANTQVGTIPNPTFRQRKSSSGEYDDNVRSPFQLFDLLATRARSDQTPTRVSSTASSGSGPSSMGQGVSPASNSPSKVQPGTALEAGQVEGSQPKRLTRAKTTLDAPWQSKH